MESIKIFDPPKEWIVNSNLSHYMDWLATNRKLEFSDYQSLWSWSITRLEDFWSGMLEYFKIDYSGEYQHVVSSYKMPGAKWFEGINLNYAHHLTRHKVPNSIAVVACNETGSISNITWKTMLGEAAKIQEAFNQAGLIPGDRVVAYLPAIPEASSSFLAASASGLIWSSCAPEFGSSSVVDRVSQIQPKVLIAVDHYQFGGKKFDRSQELNEIIKGLPSLELIIMIRGQEQNNWYRKDIQTYDWDVLINESPANELKYIPVPFDHPLWILYSSGTTGLPKAITHSHGGMLLEHLKYIHFHNEVKTGDLFFWYTTTGWMMWNYLHATWLAGATIVLFDGSPAYPNQRVLWELADQLGINHFGCGAPFIHQSMKLEVDLPALTSLKSMDSTGSPLNAEAYHWLYQQIKHPFYLWSMSGGTDMCTAFVGGCPLLPVYIGEIQCRALGCDLQVWDEDGNSIQGQEGEMVITKPMPCMPVYFWNDPGDEKYMESYFQTYPGIWRHGDWVELTKNEGLIISGRSDTTLKRFGVRIGTAEIYSALLGIEAIIDSLIIYVESQGNPYMPLFVKLQVGKALTEELINEIKSNIRKKCSPRHLPDAIFQVEDIPYTLSGKKMETAVKKIFMGKPVSTTAMRNPSSMNDYISIYRNLSIKSNEG